jgi:glycosidase
LGEIWEADPRWVNNTHFDGLMNYPVRDAALRFFNGVITASQFADKAEKSAKLYPQENINAMYNLLGSHDTERIWTLFAGDQRKVQLAFLFQFAYPGVPAIYYGDEIGLPGGRDPDCRRTFPWDQNRWNTKLRAFVQQLISLRKLIPALQRGDFHGLLADDARACYAFSRGLEDEKVLVVLNASPTRRVLRLQVSGLGWKDGLIVHNLVGEGDYIVSGNTLSISVNPTSGLWIK